MLKSLNANRLAEMEERIEDLKYLVETQKNLLKKQDGHIASLKDSADYYKALALNSRPRLALDEIDAKAAQLGFTRSGFLAQAAQSYHHQ